jgi:hypothetical protein
MAPGVSAFWGKEGCVLLYEGISRNVYNGVPPQPLPKGPAPWGPHVGFFAYFVVQGACALRYRPIKTPSAKT